MTGAATAAGPAPPVLVLVHSPLLGPVTWGPVAERLAAGGFDAVVPALRPMAAAEPPYWPAAVAAVREALSRVPTDRPVVLVGHSNAGRLLPVIRRDIAQPVAGSVFVDATLPDDGGVDGDRLAALTELADESGRLPPWTDWFDPEAVAAILPDPAMRRRVRAEQVGLPLAYFTREIPAPDGWQDDACDYVLFSPAYEAAAASAAGLGWPVHRLAGGHLHQMVEPAAVADLLAAIAAGRRGDGGPPPAEPGGIGVTPPVRT